MDDSAWDQVALLSYFLCWVVLLLLQLKKSDSADDTQQLIDAHKIVRKDSLYDHINFRMDGFLYKKNNFLFWKKRKFVLVGYELKYFEELSHNNLMWKGTFDIRNYKVISEVSTTASGVSTQLDFNLVENHYANKPIMRRLSTTGNLELNLRALSEDEKNLWVQVLNRQINAFEAAKNSNTIMEPITRIVSPYDDAYSTVNYHLTDTLSLPHKENILDATNEHTKTKESISTVAIANLEGNDATTPNEFFFDSFAPLSSLAHRELEIEGITRANNLNTASTKISTTSTIVNVQVDTTKVKVSHKAPDNGFDINTFTKTGKLVKRGSNYKTWKLRTFVLKGNELKYFDSNYNLQGQFNITDCTIMELNSEKQEGSHTFVLTESQAVAEERHFQSKKKPISTSIFKSFIISKPAPSFLRRSLYLRANSNTEMEDWITVLHRQVFAINRLVRCGKVEVISSKNYADNADLRLASPTSEITTPVQSRSVTSDIVDCNHIGTASDTNDMSHHPTKINPTLSVASSPEKNDNYITKLVDHVSANETIILSSPVKLYSAFNRTSKRILVLTDRPRLLILDLLCETILGDIFWPDETGLFIDKLDDFNFKISTEDREYKFFDSNITANQWYDKILQVNTTINDAQHRNFNGSSVDSCQVSPEIRRRSITGDDEDFNLDGANNNIIISEFLTYEGLFHSINHSHVPLPTHNYYIIIGTILFSSLVKKKSITGISYKLWLVLTDAPRIYLVDNKTKKVFDDIYWPQTHFYQLDETSFKIISEDKEEIFWDDFNGSEIWIAHFKSLSKSIVNIEERVEILDESQINYVQKYLKNDEEIVFKSVVRKYKHIGLFITVRRELVITSKSRIIYLDPKSKMLLGEINMNSEGTILPRQLLANDSLGIEKINDFQFKIILEEKELIFIDDYHGSQFWLDLIEKHVTHAKIRF